MDEHRYYVYQMVHLELFFLWNWLQDHPDESLSSALRKRVGIYRKTAVNTDLITPVTLHYDSAEWLAYERDLQKLFEKHNDNVQAFEDDGFEIFHGTLDKRLPIDFANKKTVVGFQCGSLRYNTADEGEICKTIGFHIANALQPESFFADPQYLPKCLIKLMQETEAKYSSTHLSTGTWLNSLPKWLELFPQEWQDNMSEPDTDIQSHYGFWGQFITARGTFNYKYGKILRKTGKLPFYRRTSSCSFEAMKKHLKDKFNI